MDDIFTSKDLSRAFELEYAIRTENIKKYEFKQGPKRMVNGLCFR
jgi:hypothetical protein